MAKTWIVGEQNNHLNLWRPIMRQRPLLTQKPAPGPNRELTGYQTGLVFFGNQVFFDYVPSSAPSLLSSGTNPDSNSLYDLEVLVTRFGGLELSTPCPSNLIVTVHPIRPPRLHREILFRELMPILPDLAADTNLRPEVMFFSSHDLRRHRPLKYRLNDRWIIMQPTRCGHWWRWPNPFHQTFKDPSIWLTIN